MAATSKPRRRTAERILQTTLELFNRFGEPNVPTALIATELGISPGNLYYHYPAKDELITTLFERYDRALGELLDAAGAVRHVEDAWLFLHMLFELIWAYRFLYRDLNDLLSKNRRVELRLQFIVQRKTQALQTMLRGLHAGGAMRELPDDPAALATAMVVLLTYWLSFEYVCQPRKALEPQHAAVTLARGAWHVLGLLAPHLEGAARVHLDALAASYRQQDG